MKLSLSLRPIQLDGFEFENRVRRRRHRLCGGDAREDVAGERLLRQHHRQGPRLVSLLCFPTFLFNAQDICLF